MRCEIAMAKVLLPALAMACILALLLTGCQSVPVDRPCGVIRDSLKTVRGVTPADARRIDIHYERGRAAGCWQ